MKYWDSSAIVPLIVPETKTEESRNLIKKDRQILTWMLTETEILSALCRKLRDGSINLREFNSAKRHLFDLKRSWIIVTHAEKVQQRANILLERYPLRAFDALHLASAEVAINENYSRLDFVTYDARLQEAAYKEGFNLCDLQ